VLRFLNVLNAKRGFNAAPTNSGGLAMFTATRRASSRVSRLHRRPPTGLDFAGDIREHLAVWVPNANALCRFVNGPGQREAA
jgi:hypothetical protein